MSYGWHYSITTRPSPSGSSGLLLPGLAAMGAMADQLERAGAALGRCPSPSAPQSEARCGAWLSRRMLAGRLDREGRARGFGATATFRGGPPGAVKQSRRAML